VALYFTICSIQANGDSIIDGVKMTVYKALISEIIHFGIDKIYE
jgi:hypothetical protein